MTVSTLEELLALPERAEIHVHSDPRKAWARTADGFSANGITLRPEVFEGVVKAGSVSRVDTRPPAVGEWFWHSHYGDKRYVYVVMGPAADEGRVRVASFRYMRFRGLSDSTHAQLTTDGTIQRWPGDLEKPDWFASAWSMVTRIYDDERRFAEAQQQRAEAGERISELERQAVERMGQPGFIDPAVLGTRMHAYIVDQGIDSDDALFGIMDELGVNIGIEHQSQAQLFGTAHIRPDDDTIRAILPGADIDEVSNAEVQWSYYVTVTKRGNGCTCESVTDAELREQLPEQLRSLDFEHNGVECV